jgi:hypothetical protein
MSTVGTEPVPPDIGSIEVPSPQLLKYYVLSAIATTITFPLTVLLFYFAIRRCGTASTPKESTCGGASSCVARSC